MIITIIGIKLGICIRDETDSVNDFSAPVR